MKSGTVMGVVPQSACSPQSDETESRLSWTDAGVICCFRGGNLTSSLHHDTEEVPWGGPGGPPGPSSPPNPIALFFATDLPRWMVEADRDGH